LDRAIPKPVPRQVVAGTDYATVFKNQCTKELSMKFVIIGGDAAGMSAASRAKRNDPGLDVIVLEQTTDVSYSACGMPYNVADAARVMDDLVVRHAKVFKEKQGIDVRLGHHVERIDRAGRKVTGHASNGEAFSVDYDKLLIATGARSVRLNVPGVDLPGVLALKSLEDGRRIKDYMDAQKVTKALIIGMGYIGLEMAEAFHSRGVSVVMAEALPRLLPYLPEELSDLVAKELQEKGVQLRLGTKARGVKQAGGSLIAELGEDVLPVDMILTSVGVVPNAEIAAAAGLELGPAQSVAVDKALRTSDPDIFAAGDCADAFHVVSGERVWIPLALRANRAGWAVGDNVTGRNVQLPGIAGSAVFKCLDMEVARTGLSLVEATKAGFSPVEGVVRSRSRAHSHPGNQTIHVHLVADKNSGKLLGGSLVGKEGAAHRINSLAVALHAGMTVEEFFQCDMAYAPPFSPVWDPLLTGANQLLKKL
jgi:CoA-dependent NAD(P)H sulfur oxidoreductase